MGRFHRHRDGTVHEHGGADHAHASSDEHHNGARDHVDVGDHSGYGETGTARVEVLEDILAENDRIAEANRADLLAAGVRTVNLMSAPGAGKTTLLRRTLEALRPHLRLGVLEGDIATSIDADRLEGLGAAVALVNTSAGFEANVTSTPSWCASVCAACRSTTSTCCSSRTSATWLRGVAAPMITRGADQP